MGGWPSFSFLFPNPEKGAPSLRSLLGRAALTFALWDVMPSGFHPTYAAHHLYFVTCSCYRRITVSAHRAQTRPLADDSGTDPAAVPLRGRGIRGHARTHSPADHRTRDRQSIDNDASLEQRSARALLPKRKRADPRQSCLFGDTVVRSALWQARFYDFNVWTLVQTFVVPALRKVREERGTPGR
jgi:hypothetical protein